MHALSLVLLSIAWTTWWIWKNFISNCGPFLLFSSIFLRFIPPVSKCLPQQLQSEEPSLTKHRTPMYLKCVLRKPELIFASWGSKRRFDVKLHMFFTLTVGKGQYLTFRPLYLCWKRVLFPLSMKLVWPQGWPDGTSQKKNPNFTLSWTLFVGLGSHWKEIDGILLRFDHCMIWYVLLKSLPLNIVPTFVSSGKWSVSFVSLYKVFVYKKLNLILTKELRGT
jgi:hypothetical protein